MSYGDILEHGYITLAVIISPRRDKVALCDYRLSAQLLLEKTHLVIELYEQLNIKHGRVSSKRRKQCERKLSGTIRLFND